MSDSDPDELIIEDPASPPSDFDDLAPPPQVSPVVVRSLELASGFFRDFDFSLTEVNRLAITCPSGILPRFFAHINGFDHHPHLMTLSITLADPPFTTRPALIEVSHPVFGSNFSGSPLVKAAILNFFTGQFKPKKSYRSWPLVRTPIGKVSDASLAQLVQEGFSVECAARGLLATRNGLAEARRFLLNGPSEKMGGRP
jgi:hypothetical protein